MTDQKALNQIGSKLQNINACQQEIRLRIDEIGYGDNVPNNVEMIRDRTTQINHHVGEIEDILTQLLQAGDIAPDLGVQDQLVTYCPNCVFDTDRSGCQVCGGLGYQMSKQND